MFVCFLKLHKTVVYRLALYEVLSAMEFSAAHIGMVYAVVYSSLTVERTSCYRVRSIVPRCSVHEADVYRVDINTSICSCVFHKNLQILEPLYVVSSLLVSLIVTATLLGINLTQSRAFAGLIEDILCVHTILFPVLVLITAHCRHGNHPLSSSMSKEESCSF